MKRKNNHKNDIFFTGVAIILILIFVTGLYTSEISSTLKVPFGKYSEVLKSFENSENPSYLDSTTWNSVVSWRKPKSSDDIDPVEFHTSPNSRKISVDGKNDFLLSKKIPVEKGNIYKLCVWVKSKNDKANVKIGLVEYDENKKKIKNNWLVLNSRTVPKRWAKYCEVMRNEDATSVHVRIEANSKIRDKVWVDDATFELMPEFLPAYGCENSETSVCLDFGKEKKERENGRIEFNRKRIGDKGMEGETTYRNFGVFVDKRGFVDEGLLIHFRDFNILPTDRARIENPMILEIRYKDDFKYDAGGPDFRLKISTKYNPRGNNNLWNTHEPLWGYNDGKWKIVQYYFYPSDFPMISSKNRRFSILLHLDDTGFDHSIKIDYLTLREVSYEDIYKLQKMQRDSRGFYNIYRPKSKGVINGDLVVYSKNIMESVYSDTVPNLDEITDTIETFGFLGDIEPMSFSVYSENGIDNLNIQVSDFVHVNNPEGDDNNVGTISDVEVNEIVYNNKRVYRKGYDYIPDYLNNIADLDNVNIPELSSKRFWIKVRIPEDSLPGEYVSTVTLNSMGLTKSIQLKLNVYGIKLEDPEFLNAINADFDTLYSKDEETLPLLMKDLGFDTVIVTPYEIPMNSNKVMDLATYGLAKRAIVVRLKRFIFKMNNIRTLEMDPQIRRKIYEILSDTDFVLKFGEFVEKVIEYGKNNGYEIYFLISDEVGNGDVVERIMYDRLSPIIQSKNGKVFATYHTTAENPISTKGEFDGVPNDIIPGVGNLVDLKIGQIYEQHEVYNKDSDNYGGYYTTQVSHFRNPIYNRFLHGIFAWKMKVKFVYAFSMNHIVGDPYNDFDASHDQKFPATDPDMVFVYPNLYGPNKLTMNAEGIREGIKDAKYIATLKKLIAKNKGSLLAKEAQTYLTSLRENIKINYNNYVLPGKKYKNMEIVDDTFYKENYMMILADISESSDSYDYGAFSNFRERVAKYIVQLN